MSQPSRARAFARLSLTLSAVSLALFALPARAAAPETADQTFAASVTPLGAFADAGTRQPVSISADGRLVAFVSAASNLAADAPHGVAEAYVKDLETGELTLASRAGGAEGAPANEPPPGEQPQTGIERALISANGRYLLFTSRSTNLAGDELPLPLEEAEEFFSTHVYRRDLATGETELVDRETGAAGPTHLLEARGEAISADGRLVVFRAEAPDLGDPAGEHESTGSGTIYVRDMQAGTTVAVSRASGAEGELANARGSGGAISADGRFVAFTTFATNPGLGGEANEAEQVYLRGLEDPFATTLLSRSSPTETDPAGAQGDGESFEPAFLGADCRVGFSSEASNLAPGGGPSFQVYVRDLCAATPSTTLVGLDEGGLPFEEAALLGGSGDGRGVLFTGETAPGPRHLYLRDLGADRTALVDRASGAAGPAADLAVEQGAISANGCRVAFTSPATNLSAEAPPSGGSSQPLQVYVRQLAPCRPAPEESPASPPAPVGGGGGPVHGTLAIAGLSRAALRLRFSAPGVAMVRIVRLAGRRGQRRRPARAFAVTAAGPGVVRVRLPRLAPGRYRLSARLREAGSPTLTRVLTIESAR